MTLNEMRYIYPAYREKERLLKEKAEWAELYAECDRIRLEELQQKGIVNDERNCHDTHAHSG